MSAAAKWLGACLLALAIVSGQLLDQWDAWRVAAEKAEAAQLANLARQGEEEYIRWAQGVCGAETWWKQRADGARVCTTKHGRPTGQLLAGANP